MSLLYSVLCNLCPSVTFRHLPSPSVTFRHLPSSSVTFRHSLSLSVTHGEQCNFVPPYILPQLSALFRTFSVILNRIITVLHTLHSSNDIFQLHPAIWHLEEIPPYQRFRKPLRIALLSKSLVSRTTLKM